jgi:hypothetical protein
MNKPSKKVIGIMIVTFGVVVAFIGSDALRNKDLNKKLVGEVEGVNIESASKVKSIEDFMLEKQAENLESIPEEFIPKTVSDFVLFEVMGNYNQLVASGQDTPENIELLASQIAEQTEQFTKIPNKYTMFDLRTFSDSDKDAVKSYGNEFALTVEEYYNRFPLINDEDSLAYVTKYANTYGEYADALSKIRVPRGVLNEHLDFINNLYKINVALIKVAETEDDPALTYLIIKQYEQIIDSQPRVLGSISKYFELGDIIFSDDDPGLMWNNY